MTTRVVARTSLTWLVLLALGCSGRSSTSFDASPGSGGSGAGGDTATGGTGGSGGSTSTSGTGGDGGTAGSNATGGNGATGGASSSGAGGTGEAGEGSPGGAGNGAGGGAGNGAAGSAGSGAAGAATGPDISGRWAMFYFEDPVAVSIEQRGTALGGTGCCAGLGSSSLTCCGPLAGSCENGVASFSFDIEAFGVVYGTNVYVAEDRTRLGGTFGAAESGIAPSGTWKVAWVPLPDQAGSLGSALPPLSDVLRLKAGGFELRLLSAFAGRFDFNETFALALSDLGYLSSDFGPFWWGEMSWDQATQTLKCGPVAATDPSFATMLELTFDGNTLTGVTATYPDDPPYLFTVQPPPLP